MYGCAKLILFHVHEETCVFGNDFSLYVERQTLLGNASYFILGSLDF